MDTVKIGKQIWQPRNLSVDRFSNGDKIYHAQTPEDWEMACEKKMPAWCYYDGDERNGIKLGKLYNWYAVVDPRGLAPVGFKIPSQLDWNELIEYLGGSVAAGHLLKGGSQFWNNHEQDEIGFKAMPGGTCNEGNCCDIGEWGCWWSCTEYNDQEAFAFHLSDQFEEATFGFDDKNWALSVRCLEVNQG